MHSYMYMCMLKRSRSLGECKILIYSTQKKIHSEELHPSIALWTINSGLLAHQL